MMDGKIQELLNRLVQRHSLELEEYQYLLDHRNEEVVKYIQEKAVEVRQSIYGNQVYTRGLIEISNICKNDCLYCGIRASNSNCQRYRLTKPEILSCVKQGVDLGFKTVVLQGGEDPYYSDEILVDIVKTIRSLYPDIAITLSLGQRSHDSYQALYDAGANRYLLRHETADEIHYGKLHPSNMSWQERMDCIYDLKSIGFQVGVGIMVGSPYQSNETIAKDLKFIETIQPDMCGIGPFVPHHDTPFATQERGSVELTCFLLSLIRLIWPPVLLPSTTALGTIDPKGREKGILAGGNVVMPNLSPELVKAKYELYDGKIHSGNEAGQNFKALAEIMNGIDYELVHARGDVKKEDYIKENKQ